MSYKIINPDSLNRWEISNANFKNNEIYTYKTNIISDNYSLNFFPSYIWNYGDTNLFALRQHWPPCELRKKYWNSIPLLSREGGNCLIEFIEIFRTHCPLEEVTRPLAPHLMFAYYSPFSFHRNTNMSLPSCLVDACCRFSIPVAPDREWLFIMLVILVDFFAN